MTAALTWAEGVFLIPWVQLPGWWFALRHKKPVSSFRGQGCRSPRSAGGQGSHLWGHPWHTPFLSSTGLLGEPLPGKVCA